MLKRSFALLSILACTASFLAAQPTALDKAFHLPANFRESPSQLDSFLALGPLSGNAENYRLCMISRLYRESDAVKALELAQSSMEKIEKTNDSTSLYSIYGIYANSLFVQGNFPAAEEYFTKALLVMERMKDTLSLATKYITLAYASKFTVTDEFKTKMDYLGKSYELFKKVKNYAGMGGATYGMGGDIFYKVTENNLPSSERKLLLKRALRYNILADSIWKLGNLKDRRAAAIVSQAQIHHLMGRVELAKSLIRKAYAIHKNEKSSMGMQRCAWNMARILESEQKYDSAIFFIRQSATLLQTVNANYDLADNYDFQTKLFKAMKDYKEALRTSELARRYREKSFNTHQQSEVARIKNSYDNQLKDGRIKELETEKQLQESIARQRQLLAISVFSILAIVIGLGTFAYYQRQKSINQMKENIRLGGLLQRNLEDKLQDTQLAALKAQMNPHFVGNAISAVQSLILQEKKEDALHYLNDFSKLTRHALENSKKETISLKEEVEFLYHYFHLEQLRYPSKFDFEIIVDPSIDDPGYERIPPMMVQPFVENAIKHGLHGKNEKGLVKVCFQLAEAALLCTIEDNGVGREATKTNQEQRKSHSIAITDARLELLQKKADLQKKYKIQIEDLFDEARKAAGTKVMIVIPTDIQSLMTG